MASPRSYHHFFWGLFCAPLIALLVPPQVSPVAGTAVTPTKPPLALSKEHSDTEQTPAHLPCVSAWEGWRVAGEHLKLRWGAGGVSQGP